jgi:hypothetical protein
MLRLIKMFDVLETFDFWEESNVEMLKHSKNNLSKYLAHGCNIKLEKRRNNILTYC